MGFSIADLALLKSAASNMAALIEACRPRGPFYTHDKDLTNAVIRGAKALETSLGHLQKAVEDPHHRPSEPRPSTALPLVTRLGLESHLYELARYVNYGGKRPDQMKEFMAGHRARHGDKAMWAMHELTATQEGTGLTVLRPEARRVCRALLGPAPESEEYQAYWKRNGCEPPPEHQPPPPSPEPEAEAGKAKKPRGRGRGR